MTAFSTDKGSRQIKSGLRGWALVSVVGGELPGPVVAGTVAWELPSQSENTDNRHPRTNQASNPYGASDADLEFLRGFDGCDASVKIGYILSNSKFISLEVQHFVERLELKFLRSLQGRKKWRGLNKKESECIDMLVLVCRRASKNAAA